MAFHIFISYDRHTIQCSFNDKVIKNINNVPKIVEKQKIYLLSETTSRSSNNIEYLEFVVKKKTEKLYVITQIESYVYGEPNTLKYIFITSSKIRAKNNKKIIIKDIVDQIDGTIDGDDIISNKKEYGDCSVCLFTIPIDGKTYDI